MKLRTIWLAFPACAAGVFGFSTLGAQESPPRAAVVPGAIKPPDTRAAQGLFGPPPTPVGAGAASAGAPVPPPLFFPNASPPPNETTTAAVPAGLPMPRVIVESTDSEPTLLPVAAKMQPVPAPAALEPVPVAAAAEVPATLPVNTQMPVISQPAASPSGPQPLVKAASHVQPAMGNPPPSARVLTYPNVPLNPRQAPSVLIECIAPESVSVGEAFEYVLVVRNAGSSAVANVRIEDEFPQSAEIVSVEPAAERLGNRLGWTFGLLEANAEKRIHVRLKTAAEGEWRSRAVVSFTAAAEGRTLVTKPLVSIALSGTPTARVGDEVAFQIRVSNSGTGPASNVVVKARLTDGLHHPAGGLIEAAIDKLPAGETKTITLRALATKSGQHECSIAATGAGISAESASCKISIVEPNLSASVAGPAKCLVRSEPEYKIELANTGTAATEVVQVWAVLPEGFEVAAASEGGSLQPANRTVVWSVPGIAAGSQRQLTLKLKAIAPADGMIRIVAQSGGRPQAESGIATASATTNGDRVIEAKAETAVKVEGIAAIRFDVVDVEDPVEVGKEALYDIRIVNQGTGPCTNLNVQIQLADGTAIAGASGPTTARGQGQAIAFDPMPTLNPKDEAVFRVRIRGLQPGDMKLRVQVSCDEIRTPITKEENTRFIKD